MKTYVMTGTLTDASTVHLDEALPRSEGKVRVTVEVFPDELPIDTTEKPRWLQVLEGIWEEQKRRGHVPRPTEEIEAQIREERESWGD